MILTFWCSHLSVLLLSNVDKTCGLLLTNRIWQNDDVTPMITLHLMSKKLGNYLFDYRQHVSILLEDLLSLFCWHWICCVKNKLLERVTQPGTAGCLWKPLKLIYSVRKKIKLLVLQARGNEFSQKWPKNHTELAWQWLFLQWSFHIKTKLSKHHNFNQETTWSREGS